MPVVRSTYISPWLSRNRLTAKATDVQLWVINPKPTYALTSRHYVHWTIPVQDKAACPSTVTDVTSWHTTNTSSVFHETYSQI